MQEVIGEFAREYFFLSNYYSSPVMYQGKLFFNAEAAFQATKCPERADEFVSLIAPEAKRLGRKVQLRSDWEQVKDQVMYDICQAKFRQNVDLGNKLLLTGHAKLVEGNSWGDTVWGVCRGKGENRLGKILMKV